ncbi:UTP--glucose-1-phosphate uridylyltransferase GalU [Pigmentiphaga daeguensis]|uniref:UTP--glucose-1-phosphate uridylyltransferase n=1 Tax=Pigmentiphaga daeguensis TaxID=414049 RepID=A0ABN1D512_9BURK
MIDKPLIQYAAEEAIRAGIKTLVFVTGRYKRAIEDHFDTDRELESELEAKKKIELLEMVRAILPADVNCVYVRQAAPLGLGHAVLCAEPIVKNEKFAVILPDDLIDSTSSVTKQLIEVARERNASVLGVEKVSVDETKKYGIVEVEGEGKSLPVKGIVEKPDPADAPSDLAVVGRYVLDGSVFSYLKEIGQGAGGEIQLTDAIARMIENGRSVIAHHYEGQRFDCGGKSGLYRANLHYGAKYHQLFP